jgi:hypothetical protein
MAIEVKEYTAVAAGGVHILLAVAAGKGGGLGLRAGLDAGVGAHVVALLPHQGLLFVLLLVGIAAAPPGKAALHGVTHSWRLFRWALATLLSCVLTACSMEFEDYLKKRSRI